MAIHMRMGRDKAGFPAMPEQCLTGGVGSHMGVNFSGLALLVAITGINIPAFSIGLLFVTVFFRKKRWPYIVGLSIVLAMLVLMFAFYLQTDFNGWQDYWTSWLVLTGWTAVLLSTAIVLVRQRHAKR